MKKENVSLNVVDIHVSHILEVIEKDNYNVVVLENLGMVATIDIFLENLEEIKIGICSGVEKVIFGEEKNEKIFLKGSLVL